ncbi:GntR family transcriptional regulator [Pseudonocardia sp. GCM10023141]|uniref:GntR family transcriptional regulator n=1 Tax=Pseudonocardia sp. GCM10023141 TaxID=3252653 RepID=UPI0036174746
MAEAEDEDRKPASRRVADLLRSEIESGRYQVGDALPTYRQLAAEHGIAVNTAMAAVRRLVDAGWATNRPNAGTYVRDRAAGGDPGAELRSVRAELSELQAQVGRTGAELAEVEERLAKVTQRLMALET